MLPLLTYESFTLANGLRVVISTDKRTPNVAVYVSYNVGSRHEIKGRSGFAHLFEHLMFQGSASAPKGFHDAIIEGGGGDLNGFTNFDNTVYLQVVPSNMLEQVLWLEASRMGGLLEELNQTNFENQRDVVKNEKLETYDNQPYGDAFEIICRELFPNHPYEHPPIGTMEDLDAATVEDAQDFWKRAYGPDNAVITIVGDIDTSAALEMVEKHFAQISPRQEPLDDNVVPLGSIEKDLHIETSATNVSAPLYVAAWRLPADSTNMQTQKELAAVNVALAILALGKASRLAMRLVYDEKLVKEDWIDSEMNLLIGGTSYLMMFLYGTNDAQVADIQKVVNVELDNLAEKLVPAAELERAKALIQHKYLVHSLDISWIAKNLGKEHLLHNDATLFRERVELQLNVTATDVQRAVQKYLSSTNKLNLWYVPAIEGAQ